MARKVLICTVGGSYQPVVTAIKDYEPDFIYFICSASDKESKQEGTREMVEGQGLVCGGNPRYGKKHDKPSIVKQLNIRADQYTIKEFLEIDNLDECFKISLEALKQVNTEIEDAQIKVDYTAGTKSMSAGLVLAATYDKNVQISLVKGKRSNTQKVDAGTEYVSSVNADSILINRKLSYLESLFKEFNYSSAITIIRTVLRYPNIPTPTKRKFENLLVLCRIFDNWDRFLHNEAYDQINIFSKELLEYKFFMQAIITERQFIEPAFNNDHVHVNHFHFELVLDLILNAERRAAQGRYDDAVARLYRSLELFAQIYLKKQYDIDTGRVDCNRLVGQLKQKYGSQDEVKIGLKESYELIAELDKIDVKNSFIRESYLASRGKILHNLSIRNQSILAHGFTPIAKEDYDDVYEISTQFIRTNIKTLKQPNKRYVQVKQFPENLLKIVGLD